MNLDPSQSLPHPEARFNRAFYLPRLNGSCYQGDAVVHWTLPISHRRQGWLGDTFHARFRELMLHTSAREGMFCPTYCLMLDHLHLVWMGLRADTDQRNGMAFLRTHLKPALAPQKFQHQAHDRVLRHEERQRGAFAAACFYDLDNPRREGLVSHPREWPYLGAVVPGYPKLHPLAEDFWEKFWPLYVKAKSPDAGQLKRDEVPRTSSSSRREENRSPQKGRHEPNELDLALREVGRVTPCAPFGNPPDACVDSRGAHGVTRPTYPVRWQAPIKRRKTGIE